MDYINVLFIMEDPDEEGSPSTSGTTEENSVPPALSTLSGEGSHQRLLAAASASLGASIQPPPSSTLVRSTNKQVPEWCKCGHCREMPQENANLCCKSRNCVSLSRRFTKFSLDKGFLQLSIKSTCNMRND